MAYKETTVDVLGGSLLDKQQARRERDESRWAKEQKKMRMQLWGAGAAGWVNQSIQDVNNFLHNEQTYKYNSQHNLASKNAQIVFNDQKGWTASGLSKEDYYFNQLKPIMEPEILANMPDKYEGGDAANRFINTQVRRVARMRAQELDQGIKLANQVVGNDTYQNIIDLNNRRPKSLLQLGIQKGKQLLTGKSNEEVDQAVALSIENHLATKSDVSLNTFMESYGRGSTAVDALAYTYFTHGMEPEWIQKQETKIVSAGDGRVFVSTVQTNTRPDGKVSHSFIVDPNDPESKDRKGKPVMLDLNNPETREQEAVKAMQVTFHFIRGPSAVLNPSAMHTYLAAAEKEGLNPSNPKTLAEYHQIRKIFEWTASQPGALKDPLIEKQIVALSEILGEYSTPMAQIMASFGKTEEERRVAGQHLTDLLAKTFLDARGLIEQAQGIRGGVSEWPGFDTKGQVILNPAAGPTLVTPTSTSTKPKRLVYGQPAPPAYNVQWQSPLNTPYDPYALDDDGDD